MEGFLFANLAEEIVLPGGVFSFEVGTRRTQGNSEAKDYEIFGLDSNGAESFHLRVSADNNLERLGYVTDDGNTASFDFPTTVGADKNDDLLNIGGPPFTASDRIAEVTVRMAPGGYIVDFDNGMNAYTTDLLSYNGSAIGLSQIGFTYQGVEGATAQDNGGPHDEKTFEFWFSAEEADTPVEQVIFEEGGSTRGINAYVRENKVFVGAWNANDDDGGLTTPWPGGVGADREGYFLSAPIESKTPYHVAMVMDGDDDGRQGSLFLYVNGKLAEQQEMGVGLLLGHTDDTSIGGVSAQTLFDNGGVGDAENHFFLGVVDEFALYNRALGSDRIFVHAGNELSPGDFNSDGNVDLTDFGILSDNFGTGTRFAQGDNNLDGMVNIQDFIEFKAEFNAAPAGAAVPEPSSLALVSFALATLLLAGRGRVH